MPKSHDVYRLAELFSALGSESRVRILRELAERPLCVGALAVRLETTQSTVSQHLTVLRNAGLVQSDKRGSFVHYSLAESAREYCRAALDEVLGQTEDGACQREANSRTAKRPS